MSDAECRVEAFSRAMARFKAKPLGEQLDELTRVALIRKAELLGLPLPEDEDMSFDACRQRQLILAAADSTINQRIKVDENALRASSQSLLPALLEKIEKALKEHR